MRGSEHITVAVATTAGAVWFFMGRSGDATLGIYAATSGAAAIGALAPDIDHPKSLISNGLPARLFALGLCMLLLVTVGGVMLSQQAGDTLGAAMLTPIIEAVRPFIGWAWALVLVAITLLAVSHVVSSLFEHRGPTHSLAAAAAFTLFACIGFALAGQPWLLGLVVGWGYLSHLMTDAITPMGLPAVLWPWVPCRPTTPSPPYDPQMVTNRRSSEVGFSPEAFSGEVSAGPRRPMLAAAPVHRQMIVIAVMGAVLAASIGIPLALVRGVAQPVASAPVLFAPEASPVTDVDLAKQRLLETNPELYGQLSNPDSPSVRFDGSHVTYEWMAVRQNSSASAQVKPASLTLDSSGQVVGFSW